MPAAAEEVGGAEEIEDDEEHSGWHYDLMLLAMNLVVLATAGGRWVLPIG